MKISRNSWHYKTAKLITTWPSDSLCLYFWQVVFAVFVCLFSVSIACLLTFTLSTPILMFIWPELAEIGVPICYILTGAAIIYLVVRLFGEAKNATFTQVAVEFIAAKKKRVCPMIEFD